VCGIKYKTRPGLKYHIKHTHKEAGEHIQIHRDPPHPVPTSHHAADEYLHEEGVPTHSSMGGAVLTPPSTPGGGSTFLDLSGSAYAAESVMNSGAQKTRINQVSAKIAFLLIFCATYSFFSFAVHVHTGFVN